MTKPSTTRSSRKQTARLIPVEGLRIPKASRLALTAFWKHYPALRQGCLKKYGFDPITAEKSYWRFGLAESDHRDVLRRVRQNGMRFTLDLVKRWERQELEDL